MKRKQDTTSYPLGDYRRKQKQNNTTKADEHKKKPEPLFTTE